MFSIRGEKVSLSFNTAAVIQRAIMFFLNEILKCSRCETQRAVCESLLLRYLYVAPCIFWPNAF